MAIGLQTNTLQWCSNLLICYESIHKKLVRVQMKKAVIATGGHQYLVSEGETLEVEKLLDEKKASFEALLVIDGDKVTVGAPVVSGVTVTADVVAQTRAEKVTAIRYEAKKRVKKIHGHRQHLTQIKITKIA